MKRSIAWRPLAARCADLGVGKLCCLLPRENCADAFFGGSQQREHILTDTAFLLSALAANGHDQCPSNRHHYRTDLLFADGHVDSPKRNDAINPNDNIWRARWNNDNDPHLPGTPNGQANWPMSNTSALEQ